MKLGIKWVGTVFLVHEMSSVHNDGSWEVGKIRAKRPMWTGETGRMKDPKSWRQCFVAMTAMARKIPLKSHLLVSLMFARVCPSSNAWTEKVSDVRGWHIGAPKTAGPCCVVPYCITRGSWSAAEGFQVSWPTRFRLFNFRGC